MRVSLINLNFIALDAIGKCLLNQVHFFRKRGDDVCVYTVHPSQGLPEDIVKLTRTINLADLIARRDAHFAQSDLYIYHYPGDYPLMESMKGLERGVVIFYYHNVTPPDLWGSTFEQEHLRNSREKVSGFVHYADLVVSDSDFNSDELIHEHTCDRERVRTLPLAVDVSRYTPGPKDLDLIRRHNLMGRQVILFVGRMANNKRIDLLIEALPPIKQRVPNALLLLVGDDQSNPAIQECVARAKARANALNITNDVIFTGPADTAPYYRLASVYASASLHEGFGVPLIEAMASGVPVVASRSTAHPWVVGEAGLFVEPGDVADLADKIIRVLTDDNLSADLVRRGLARADDFSLERYESGLAEVVSQAKAWLPNQPYPRSQSLPAQPIAVTSGVFSSDQHTSASTTPIMQDVLQNGEFAKLDVAADVMMRGYRVRSKLPVIGNLIGWIRRNLTSHLREPYVDPTFERQVAFNRQVAMLLRQTLEYQLSRSKILQEEANQNAYARIHEAEEVLRQTTVEQMKLEQYFARMEAWLGVISAQLSLLRSGNQSGDITDQLIKLQQEIDSLRRQSR